MFNLSDDYIGVSFVATLNECLNKELNEIMISSIPNETNYHKYYVGNKKYINKNSWSKNIIRKNRATYYFGTDVIGNGVDDVIAYLKDKKNQDIYLAILKEIKSK